MDKYEKDMSGELEIMRVNRSRFMRSVDKCLHTRLEPLCDLPEQLNALSESRAVFAREIVRRIDDIPGRVAEYFLTNEDVRNAVLNALTFSLSSSHNDQLRYLEANRSASASVETLLRKRSFETPALLRLLKSDPSVPFSDIDYVLRDARHLTSRDHNRLDYIKLNTRFQRFMASPRSSALLLELNDTSDAAATAFSGPLSYLCAHFANNLSMLKRTVVLTYFCGLRARDEGDDADARHMLRSLATQLLAVWDEELFGPPAVDVELEEQIKKGDISTLCDVLKMLLSQLPEKWAAFVFVDSVDMFETPDRERRTSKAAAGLLKLIESFRSGDNGNNGRNGKDSSSVRRSVKLLFTTPNRSRVIGEDIKDKWKLRVPENAAFDSVGSLNAVTL